MSEFRAEHTMQKLKLELPEDRPEVTITLPITLPQETGGTGALISEARALVTGEQHRFSALQTQATGFLAIIGVVASIGIGFTAPYLSGHDFLWPVRPLGVEFSIAAVAAICFGVLTLGGMGMTAFRVFGALRRQPDPEAAELVPIVRDQMPGMVDGESSRSTQVLLQLAATQFQRTQEANLLMGTAIKNIVLAIALTSLCGVLLAGILVFGTAAESHETFSLERNHQNVLTVKRTH